VIVYQLIQGPSPRSGNCQVSFLSPYPYLPLVAFHLVDLSDQILVANHNLQTSRIFSQVSMPYNAIDNDGTRPDAHSVRQPRKPEVMDQAQITVLCSLASGMELVVSNWL
jgi:hypothetical protein